MVERTACSNGEESNSGRSLSSAVESAVRRNEDFGASEATERLEKLENHRKPEVTRSNERSNEINRDNANTGRFSLFKWFKRGSRDSSSSWDRRENEIGARRSNTSRDIDNFDDNEITSEFSSSESVETIYSTATVRSFAFKTGAINENGGTSGHFDVSSTRHLDKCETPRSVGPFGIGASKIVTNIDDNRHDVAKTLPANVLSKRRDITARYSLQSCNGSSGVFGSCGNFEDQRKRLSDKSADREFRAVVRVHVRGKRKAPNPPVPDVAKTKKNENTTRNSKEVRRKRRLAPKPPDYEKSRISVNITSERVSATANETNVSENSTERKKNVSANLKTEGKSESEDLTTREKPISVLRENEKAVSADLGKEVKTISEILPFNEKIECETLIGKCLTVSALTTVNEETASRKNGSGIESRNRESGIGAKVMNFDEERSNLTDKIDTDKCNVEKIVIESGKSENSSILTKKNDISTLSIIKDEATKIHIEKTYDPDSTGSISNDSLVLQGGILHSKRETNCQTVAGGKPEAEASLTVTKRGNIVTTGSQTSTSAMPRPWYKRSVFENSRDSGTARRADFLRNPGQAEVREETIVDTTISGLNTTKYRQIEKTHDSGTLSRLNFFHRSDKTQEDKKKENKRKSAGISMLANISELDKEAASIVQEEQAKTRAASMFLQVSRKNDEKNNHQDNEDIVQEIVTSSMENSPKRGTRALISKFNAISNITRVTVNTSFFAKNSRETTKIGRIETSKNSGQIDLRENVKFTKIENPRTDKDLSRYFLPAQRGTATSSNEENSSRPKTSKNSNELSARLSFFQDITSGERSNRDDTRETKICRSRDEIASEKSENFNDSTKFSAIRENFRSIVTSDNRDNLKKFNNEKSSTTTVVENETDKKNSEIVQKKFSDIFREIDEKLSTSAAGGANERKSSKIDEKPEVSSQVTKVLDILVEAEKNDKLRGNFSKIRVNPEIIENTNVNESSTIKNSSTGPEIEDRRAMKTDLREMLKEMKHSLPKRPKPRKTSGEQEIVTKNVEKSLTKDDESQKTISPIVRRRKEFFDVENEKSSLQSPVTLAYPPPIRIGRICEREVRKIRPGDDRDCDRQKVSSAAQTSGNLIKLPEIGKSKLSSQDNSSKCRNNVVYQTSGIIPVGTSGLSKNTFQLIRPREFAQIEAIKTMKNNVQENAYANVIGQSLYANALVPVDAGNSSKILRINENEGNFIAEKKLNDRDNRENVENETIVADSRPVQPENMNTLAVNRLLRKLEAAIASGHHQQAAGLAKELARLKIHCSVVRQRTKAKDLINVNMYIEDKLAHQGPIPLRLARSMTVAQLKAKVFNEFEIPTNVQRWIVGKNLADDDTTKLEELQAVEGSPVFLYLVAPELKINETTTNDEKNLELPKDTEKVEKIEMSKLVEIDEPEVLPVQSQIIKEEEGEECISEEVRMERYEALISLENCDVIPNSEPIECPICFVTYGPQEGVILRDCLHMFCRPCIANTIRYCEEAEVKCPFRDTEYTCESTLQEREIKALVEPEVYQQHLAKSIAQAENNAGNNAFHCKTPDCPGWCIYDDNVNNFLCPVCGVNNCLTCQVVHTGKNCRQYQEELRLSKETDQESKRTAAMLEEMVDRGEALPCPTCAVVLMKKWGCDWLRCSMCKTEICWVTRGPRWGPGGKGDTSGGCRCGEKGIKCHPRCNYCH